MNGDASAVGRKVDTEVPSRSANLLAGFTGAIHPHQLIRKPAGAVQTVGQDSVIGSRECGDAVKHTGLDPVRNSNGLAVELQRGCIERLCQQDAVTYEDEVSRSIYGAGTRAHNALGIHGVKAAQINSR